MTANPPEIRRGVVAPVKCLKEGWAAIKDQYWLIFGVVFVGLLLGNAVPIFLWGPMMCGMYLCLLRKLRGQPVDFGMLFRGFDYFTQSLIPAALQFLPGLVMFIIYFIILFAFIATAPQGRMTQAEASAYFTTIVLMYVIFIIAFLLVAWGMMIFLLFPYALIVDRGLSGLEAVRTSVTAALANFGGILGLLFLSLLMMFAGVLACYVGAFLTWPIAFASWTVAYRRVFGDPPSEPAAVPQTVAA